MTTEQTITLLAVETSAGPASCAVLRREGERVSVLCEASVNNRLTHSQTLMPMIQDMLKNASLSLEDVTHLAVAVGPGSFTGIRIGVSAVKGLAFPNDLPCAAVSTLAGMARRMENMPHEGLILAAMDARCQQIYTALFSVEGGKVERLTPDEAMALDDVKERLLGETRPILVIGDGAAVAYAALHEALPTLKIAAEAWRYQHATGIAMEALSVIDRDECVSGDALLPAYLRLPQAERELRAKQEQTSPKM